MILGLRASLIFENPLSITERVDLAKATEAEFNDMLDKESRLEKEKASSAAPTSSFLSAFCFFVCPAFAAIF